MTEKPKEMTDDDVASFLSELTALSHKHGIAIGGCGCCGSPYLHRAEAPTYEEASYVIKRRKREMSSVEFDDLRFKRPDNPEDDDDD